MRPSLNLVLLLLVFVCGASLWFGGDALFKVSEPGNESPVHVVGSGGSATDPTGYVETQASSHVTVLNGTGRDGLAREFGMLLARLGWVAAQVGNAPHDRFARTMLVNRRLSDVRCAELASQLGGVPVLREFDPCRSEDAVLVLGADAGRVEVRLRALVRSGSDGAGG